jgi:hypothetical protein
MIFSLSGVSTTPLTKPGNLPEPKRPEQAQLAIHFEHGRKSVFARSLGRDAALRRPVGAARRPYQKLICALSALARDKMKSLRCPAFPARRRPGIKKLVDYSVLVGFARFCPEMMFLGPDRRLCLYLAVTMQSGVRISTQRRKDAKTQRGF